MEKKKPFVRASNALLFSCRELLLAAGGVLIVVLWLCPLLYRGWERIELPENFRLPYENRDNYYLYSRCVEEAVRRYSCLFLGDSAIWGMYASNTGTLPAQINRRLGREVCGNLAVDGLHCVAMKTLMENCGGAIRNRMVLIYFNPLWMNSQKYDLSGDEEFAINHPELLPQFGGIDSYRADFNKRVGTLIDRKLTFFALRRHLQNYFYGNVDMKTYLVEKSGINPFIALSRTIRPSETSHQGSVDNWSTRGIPVQHWDWVEPAQSRQWNALLATVSLLREQGNRVIVMIGGINPKLLDDATRKGMSGLRQAAAASLRSRGMEYLMLPELDGDLYADASHPMEAGYASMAEFLIGQGIFDDFRKN